MRLRAGTICKKTINILPNTIKKYRPTNGRYYMIYKLNIKKSLNIGNITA